jgi:hypothetical protein
MKNEELVKRTLSTIANGAELTAQIVLATVGNDVADSLAGEQLTRQGIYNLAVSNFTARLANNLK